MLSTAIGIEELIEKVRRYNPDAQVELIRRAYDFSAQAHEGQLRRSGEPYLAHPLAVAEILTALRLDVPAIVAGLMHDTIEDTIRTRVQIEEEIGKDIARLVEGVTKIGKIHFKSYEETQAENFRKMLISMADDIRVILIKLADRLHNMRTIEHLDLTQQKKIAQETIEIYAPLANRLGKGNLEVEIEHNNVWMHRRGDGEGFRAGRSFADHRHFRLVREEQPQPRTHHGVILNEENPDG